jgi:hypothetical protein
MAEPTPKCLFCGVKIQKSKLGYLTSKPRTIEVPGGGQINLPGGATMSETWEHDPEHVAARKDFHAKRLTGHSFEDLEKAATITAALSTDQATEHEHPIWQHLADIDEAVEKETGHVPMPDMIGDERLGRQFKSE